MLKFVKEFLDLEAAGGLVLILAAVLALFLANSAFAPHYEALLTPASHLVVNDGLMTVFFLMVTLEIKREMQGGVLSTCSQALFPVATALGGVIVPVLIYLWFNTGTENARGWAIPSATDIAFSLGVLSLFGKRIPYALTVFLMTLAVLDDLVAILIIAVFYSGTLAYGALTLAGVCTTLLFVLNRRNLKTPLPYFIIGFFLWLVVLQSGVHATMAGVILGALMPRGERVLEKIHPWVAFCILPLFAFANAGISLADLSTERLFNPLPLGIMAGLFFGKPIGIAIVAAVLIMTRQARLPENASWLEFSAVSILAGIGFTMSLFIGDLAFGRSAAQMFDMKLGVVLGSLLSAIAGCMLMVLAIQRKRYT